MLNPEAESPRLIRARGEKIVAEEKKYYPRNKYWDRLLTVTGCKGIHFSDHQVISKLICPEYSHLDPKNAILYTQNLISILKHDQGWKFNK